MDDKRAVALMRYQIISAYLALDPPRGQRRAFLDKLAQKTWQHPDGRQVSFSAETLRAWIRRYRRGGLQALEDALHPKRGVQVLTPEHVKLFINLKKKIPERSLERLIFIAEDMEYIEYALNKIADESGVEEILNLPAVKVFKIKVITL